MCIIIIILISLFFKSATKNQQKKKPHFTSQSDSLSKNRLLDRYIF